MALAVGDYSRAAGEFEAEAGPSLAADAGRQITEWARDRSLGLSSACGICIALCLCATTWFTAGTRAANFRAAAALGAGYLILLAGRTLLADPTAVPRTRGTAAATAAARAGWLATLGWGLSECAVYAGLAAGAAVEHWPGVWTLAVAVLALIAVRQLMNASAGPEEPDAERGLLRQGIELFLTMPAGGRVLLIVIVAPVWGSRAALLALLYWAIIAIGYGLAARGRSDARRVAPDGADRPDRADRSDRADRPDRADRRDWGSGRNERAAFRQARIAERRERAADRRALEADRRRRRELSREQLEPARPPWPGNLVVLLRPETADPQDEAETVAELDAGVLQAAIADQPGPDLAGTDLAEAAEAGPDLGGADQVGPDDADAAGQAAPRRSAPAAAAQVVRLRDDGMLARRLGEMVRGNLLPLPPAILGLAATAVLAYLGLQSLPGILVMTPALIMVLVAAPGSSNRHAGRLDWLVPPVLLGWQCLYVAALGQAEGVPGPVTLVLVAALLLRFADMASPGSPVQLARPVQAGQPARERGTALGWEGRMLLLGLGAAVGIAMFAYLALASYLVMLICAKILASCLRFREVDSR